MTVNYLGDTVTNRFTGNFIEEDTKLTPVNGAPGSGQYRSEIFNRAPLRDPLNNLNVYYGSTKLQFFQPSLCTQEFTTDGQKVYFFKHDKEGAVRLVIDTLDTVANTTRIFDQDSDGFHVDFNTTNDFLEIVGNFTDIFLHVTPVTASVDVSVDGAASTNVVIPSDTTLSGRNYESNTSVHVVSGLSEGLHTVKIQLSSGSVLKMHGVEFGVDRANFNVRPGKAWIGGSLVNFGSASTVDPFSTFESGTLGTKGGHAILYLDRDGTLKKNVTPTPATANTLTSTDHTGEEIYAIRSTRHFGVSTSNDFSVQMLLSGGDNRAFTLSNNSNALVGFDVIQGDRNTVRADAAGGYQEFTFNGTGADIIGAIDPDGTLDDVTFDIDGTETTIQLQSQDFIRIPIASGLSNGSHQVRVTRTSGSTVVVQFLALIEYRPMKPDIPIGSIALKQYQILGDFVHNTTSGNKTTHISEGIRRYYFLRQVQLSGTWAIALNPDAYIGGNTLTTSTNGSTLTYHFKGTAFDFRFFNSSGRTWNVTLELDGSTDFTSFTTSTNNVSFTDATGVLDANGTGLGAGSGLGVSGLSDTYHTLVITGTSVTDFEPSTFDVHQRISWDAENRCTLYGNNLEISQFFHNDLRRFEENFTMLDLPRSLQTGKSAQVSTTSNSFQILPDMITQIRTRGGDIKITFSGSIVAGSDTRFRILVDFIDIQNFTQHARTDSTSTTTVYYSVIVPLDAGIHLIQVEWNTVTGTATARENQRYLYVEELPK